MKSIASRTTIDPAAVAASAMVAKRGNGRANRQTVFRQAKLVLAGGEQVDVIMKSVSETGAKVEFFKRVTLSEIVRVTEQSLNMDRWARIVWQKEGSAGIKFLSERPKGK